MDRLRHCWNDYVIARHERGQSDKQTLSAAHPDYLLTVLCGPAVVHRLHYSRFQPLLLTSDCALLEVHAQCQI